MLPSLLCLQWAAIGSLYEDVLSLLWCWLGSEVKKVKLLCILDSNDHPGPGLVHPLAGT